MSHLATTAVPWICELHCFVGCRAARDVHVALVAVSLRRTNEEDIAGTKDRIAVVGLSGAGRLPDGR